MERPTENPSLRRWTVEPQELPVRLDIYLVRELSQSQGLSRGVIARLIKQGSFFIQKVNDAAPQAIYKTNLKLKGGEVIEWNTTGQADSGAKKGALKLPKLYEDEHLVAINKPAGLLTHPTSSLAFKLTNEIGNLLGINKRASVLNWIKENYPDCNKVPRYGIVHRLDAATSGVLLIAKNTQSYWCLLKLFRKHLIAKTYLALVWGKIEPASGVFSWSLKKKYSRKRVRVVVSEKDGKMAITHYKVLKQNSNTSLLEIKPQTGRTHQIRLHLAHAGHPVCADPFYGKSSPKDGFGRLMLHACQVQFKPFWKKSALTIKAPVPKEFSFIRNPSLTGTYWE